MSEITQRLPPVVAANPVHPNAKTTTHITNGTTTTKTNITSPVCRNCKTQTTPLWRRDETGQVLCNACGLFLKLHGRARPISLKTDTIKSRNRIKQPNSAKSSSPNTPELKSKDSTSSVSSIGSTGTVMSTNGSVVKSNGGKKSPKSHKSKKSMEGSLTPLLPARQGSQGTPQLQPLLQLQLQQHPHQQQQQQQQHMSQHHTFSIPHPMNVNGNFLPHHLSHQVQPLHYPSSTPAQFAPGLQRITSPLLLSTTSSISNARSSSGSVKPLSAAAQAAGALENMSNELGPSASFKMSGGSLGVGRSLISKEGGEGNNHVKNERLAFSTPSSALNPPKLPALGSNVGRNTSPLFGAQFGMDQKDQAPPTPQLQPHISQPPQATPDSRPTSLPPILGASGSPSLPPFNNLAYNKVDKDQQPGERKESGSERGGNHNEKESSGDNSNSNNNNNNNNSNNNDKNNEEKEHTHNEITVLKTRISELELVNDLYRTRIMELEAMEQAARLREISMRKRLDEVLYLHEGGHEQLRAPPAPAPAPAPPSHQYHPHQHTPASYGQLRFSLPPIHQAVDSVKREYDGPDSSSKKLKLDT